MLSTLLVVHGLDLAASPQWNDSLADSSFRCRRRDSRRYGSTQHGELAAVTALTRSERLGSSVFTVL
jgi:hypothetical protein